MKIRSTCLTVMFMLLFTLVLAANLQAEEKTLNILAPWEAAGQIFKVGPDTVQFIGTFQGIMYIEDGSDELDAALLVCPATQEINMATNETVAHGRCMITESGGSRVYAEFTCKGRLGSCDGNFKLTGGEGPYQGIQGSSKMVIRSALGGMAVDMDSGSVIRAAKGLAAWPNLKYTVPTN